eukprot:UN03659
MKTMLQLVALAIFASFTVEAYFPMPQGCVDSGARCAYSAGHLYCSSRFHINYMKMFCKKACGFCPEVSNRLVGCFDSPGREPTKLKELIFTERDTSSKVWNGIPIDWNNWDAYMTALINRYAIKAENKGYKVFWHQIFCRVLGILNNY